MSSSMIELKQLIISSRNDDDDDERRKHKKMLKIMKRIEGNGE